MSQWGQTGFNYRVLPEIPNIDQYQNEEEIFIDTRVVSFFTKNCRARHITHMSWPSKWEIK